jgi:hypothetical protein
MLINTSSHGIFQSDIIIRTALVEALRRIKEQPWLLDFAFASLAQDDYAKLEYGDKELEKIKNWIIATDIPVVMSYNRDKLVTPLIGISLEDSSEAESTFSDTSKEGVDEDVNMSTIISQPDPIVGPFTPLVFTSATGQVVLPNSVDLSGVYPGMSLLDRKNGIAYLIEGVSGQTLTIPEDVVANFTNAIIAAPDSLYKVNLESCEFKETYRLDAYVSGNPTLLLYLHSLLIFIVMRYKEELLEARGFERSTVVSKGITGFQTENGPEFVYQRTVLLNGYVKHYWPKEITGKLLSVGIGTPTGVWPMTDADTGLEIGPVISDEPSVGPE